MGKALALALLLAACGDDGDPCGQPSYGGNATDEVWRAMVDGEARVMVGDARAPVVTTPAEGQMVSGALRVAWTSSLASKPHLPPVTGDVYLVRITVPGRMCPIERLATELEWNPSAEEVTAMRGQDLGLQITSAYLVENRITEGPFRPAAARSFRVQP